MQEFKQANYVLKNENKKITHKSQMCKLYVRVKTSKLCNKNTQKK